MLLGNKRRNPRMDNQTERINKIIAENINKILEQRKIGRLWLLRKIYDDLKSRGLLGAADVEAEVQSQKSNFINALNGKRALNRLYLGPIERILGITIADLSEEDFRIRTFVNRGLHYTASLDSYQAYLDLFNGESEDPDSTREVWSNYDEYDNNLLDYIFQFKSLEGLKALHNEKGAQVNYWDNRNLNVLIKGPNQATQVLELICYYDSPEVFADYFDIYRSFIECPQNSDWLGVLGEEKNLALVLKTAKILDSILTSREFKVSELNPRASVKSDINVKLAHPYIHALLAFALSHCDLYLEQAKQLVKFGIKHNQGMKKEFQRHAEFADCAIDDKGIIRQAMTVYGNIVTYKTETQTNYDQKLEDLLNDLNNSINDLQFIEKPQAGGLSPQNVRVENGRLLKSHSDNEVEFEFLRQAKPFQLPFIPNVIERGEKFDAFTYFKGQSLFYRQDMPMDWIKQVMEAIKQKDEISKRLLGDGRVYVHGDLSPRNIIFDQGKLVGFIDWDTTHIGDESEDLIYALWQLLNIGYLNRNNNQLYERFKEALAFYHPSAELKHGFADKIIDVMDKAGLSTPKDSPNYQRVFEWVGWSKLWVELFRDQITQDIG